MRLNHCALVSGFLFVAIVLADYHLEKPRRLLNKQNINAASDGSVPWAGASLSVPGDSLGVYTSTIGEFTAPLAWGASGNTGFSIAVSIGGTGVCGDGTSRLFAGVNVYLNDGVVSYAAELQWGNQTREPRNITIDTGDFLRATVNVDSHTTGSALLENLSKNQTWKEDFTQESVVVCQESAEWVVAALPGFPADMPVPIFGIMAFSNATVKTTHGESAPAWSGGATVQDMAYNNTTFLIGESGENTVFVSRETRTLVSDALEGILNSLPVYNP